MTDQRPPRGRPPTRVREAIESGFSPRIVTESGIVSREIDEPHTKPVDMGAIPRIEERQREAREDMLELARGVGELRIEMTGKLTEIAASTKARADALIKTGERDERREQREADERKTRGTGRKEITLAIIAAVVTLASAVFVGRSLATTPPPPSSPPPTPAAVHP